MKYRLLAAFLLIGSVAHMVPDEVNAQSFGRNKVQYRSFDFQIIQTEHFDVYFYEEAREAALDVARMAERAYGRLSRILQHEFREKKPIILYASHADFQQTNTYQGFLDEGTGAFAEVLKSRVVIPLTGTYAEFDHVLRHELVHSFQHDILFRNAAIDNANPFAVRLPLWFMEGMAEYLSIGQIDVITAAWLRDASLAGYLRSIPEMNRRDDYLSYRFGQALWAYIGSKWGDEVVGVLLQKATRIGVERAFQTTIGMSLEELSREWTAEVRSVYLPQVTEFERPEAFGTAVLRHRRLEDPSYLAPALSPDGRTMAVFSARDGFFPDLWLADVETGKFLHRVVSSSRESNFESLRYSASSASFSPDGRYLAFAAQTGGRDALYIYDIQRKRIHRKLEFQLNAIMNPDWSPDGSQLVFAGLDGGLSDLFITDLRGNLRRLTNDRHADLFPSWSPDGRTIAFSTDRGADTDFDRLTYSNLQIALYQLDDGTIEVLPHQEVGKNLNAVWLADSRSLVWVSDRTGIKNLYLYDRDQRELSRITDFLAGVMGPTATDLSPTLAAARDSDRLLFVYFESAGHSIFSIDSPRDLTRVALDQLPMPQAVPIITADAPARPRVDPVGAGTDSVREAVGISFYREGREFRQSDVIPEGSIVAQAPVSVIALLDSAAFALPDVTDFNITNYKVRFSPDIIGRPSVGAQVGGNYGNGLFGGSYISLSDMLGNHNIMLAGSINGSLSDATFYTGYNFLKTRANYGVALSQMPLYRYLGGGFFERPGSTDVVAADVFLRDVMRSAQGMVSYPFNTFQRLELGANAVYIKEDLITRGVNLTRNEVVDDSERLADAKYLQPSAALVFDNSLFGWTGPILGRRYRIQASRSLGDFNYSEGLVDFRNYTNYKQKVVFASQFLGLVRAGADADRFALYWGGPYFVRGYDANSFDTRGDECSRAIGGGQTSLGSCPARDQLIGSSAAMIKTELRFPVISELQIGFLGNFPPVDAVLFFDGGIAWDNEVCEGVNFSRIDRCSEADARSVKLVWDRKDGQDPLLFREPMFSYGLGLRLNVFYTVLRLDYAFPVNRPDRGGRFSLGFGPSF